MARRLAALLCLLLAGPALAAPAAAPSFATAAQGRAVLSQRDDFVARLSPFDRAARLKVAGKVDEAQYLKFVGAAVIEWSADERQRVGAALRTVEQQFRTAALPFPPGVLLVRTTGAEEGGAEYTRGSAIVFPSGVLDNRKTDLVHLLGHELFHIISRRDPRLRDRLYASIGFERCPEFAFPPGLAARRITDPDAPHNDHRIRLRYHDHAVWGIPVLYADRAAWDPARGGEFFEYMQFRFALTGIKEDPAGAPALVPAGEVEGFLDQVGRNTQYLIHPEEVLADNFAILLAGGSGQTKSPSVPRNMLRIMQAAAVSAGRSGEAVAN